MGLKAQYGTLKPGKTGGHPGLPETEVTPLLVRLPESQPKDQTAYFETIGMLCSLKPRPKMRTVDLFLARI